MRLHVIEQPGGFPGVDQRYDVRMSELRRDADLAQEPLGAERRGDLGAQDFDGDLATVFFFFGQVHGRHAAATQLTLDGVAIGERRNDGSDRRCLGHDSPKLSRGPHLATPAAQREHHDHGADGDAQIGDIKGPEADVADTHIDEVDDTGVRSQSIDQIADGAAHDQRDSDHTQPLGRPRAVIEESQHHERRDRQQGKDDPA